MTTSKALRQLRSAFNQNKPILCFVITPEQIGDNEVCMAVLPRERVLRILRDLEEFEFLKKGTGDDEDSPWSQCVKSAKDLTYYRFTDNYVSFIELAVTMEDNLETPTYSKEPTISDEDALLDLYKKSKEYESYYTIMVKYSTIEVDPGQYDGRYSPEPTTDEEREALFNLLRLCKYKGETDEVFYAWIGNIKDWDKHTYYRFDLPDGTGHIELTFGTVADNVPDEEIDNYMNTIDTNKIKFDGPWISK